MNKIILLFGSFFFPAIVLTGCYKVPQLPSEVIPQVEAALVESRDVQLYSYATGFTEASHSVDIAARVEGFLQEIFFTEADVVEKGMPLFLIEQQNYQAQYDLKLANLEVLKAKWQLTEADLARAAVILEQDAIPEQEYQIFFANNEQAKASVKAGEAEVLIAKINLDYTTISSPIKGMINRKAVDIGNVVGPSNGPTLLTTIKCLNPLYVYIDLTDVQFNTMMNRLAQIHADDNQVDDSEPKAVPLLQTEEGRELVPFEMALAGDLTEKGLPAYHYRGMIN